MGKNKRINQFNVFYNTARTSLIYYLTIRVNLVIKLDF